jgi:hypothetical protein
MSKSVKRASTSRGRGQKSITDLEKELREIAKENDGLNTENISLRKTIKKLEIIVSTIPKEPKLKKVPVEKSDSKTSCKACKSKKVFLLDTPRTKILICKDCGHRERS